MKLPKHRLGEVLDDYCPRCRLLLNHAVVGMVADEIKKVRCQTCMNEHTFRHGRLPKKRNSKATLYSKVLEKVVQEGKVPADPDPDEKKPRIRAVRKAKKKAEAPVEEKIPDQAGDQTGDQTEEQVEEQTAAAAESIPDGEPDDENGDANDQKRKPRSHSLAAQLGVKRSRPTEPVSPSVRQQQEARKGPPQRGQRPAGRGGPPGRGPRQGPRNKRAQQGGVDPHQWTQPGKLHFGKTNMGRGNKNRGRR
jgi:hypothetical protein